MNEIIINEIATELNVKINQVETVLKLLEEGNTIPFIARYRKEATGALDEEIIRKEFNIPDNLIPSPTPSSFPYACAVSI